MPTAKITKRVIDGLRSAGEEVFVWDTEVSGFGVRVRASGAASYVVQYRAGNGRGAPTRRLTLYPVGRRTPDEARRDAKAKLGAAAAGGDPAMEKARAREAMTVAQLCDLYLEEGCALKKPRTLVTDRSRIERHIKPLLGARKIAGVTAVDIEKAMRDVAAGKTACDKKTGFKGRAIVRGGKGVANQVVALLSATFSFAVARKLVGSNPALGVKKYRSNAGERFLTSEELDRLGSALREAETVGIAWEPSADKKVKHAPKPGNRRVHIAPSVAAAIRLLVLTGARLGEILNLRWTEVDFERGLLTLPDTKTGRKVIILNGPALAILAELPRVGTYVIPGDSAGQPYEKPRSDLKRPWKLVCERAGLSGVRLHDLRHTNASFIAAAGLGLPIIGRLLGHTQASTTARYAHLADDPLRRAADRVGSDIARAMGEAPVQEGTEVDT
jgi:integrase